MTWETPSSFAAGKGSALVIDIGHSTASVTPVVDGFVLRKGIQKKFYTDRSSD
jgi:actin-related protein